MTSHILERTRSLLPTHLIAAMALVVCVAAPHARAQSLLTPRPDAAAVTARIDALLEQCQTARGTGQFSEMEGWAREAVDLARGIDDRMRLFQSLSQLGASFYYRSRIVDALAVHQQAYELAQVLDNKQAQATALNNLGIEYREMHDYERALPALTRARDITRSMGRLDSVAQTSRNISHLFVEIGDFDRARTFAEEGLKAARESGQPVFEALVLEQLGIVDSQTEHYREAFARYDEALAVAAELNMPAVIHEISLNRALAQWANKDHEASLASLQKLLPLVREARARENEAYTLAGIGACLLALGRLDEAAGHLSAARRIYAELDDLPQRSWLVDLLLARVERARGRTAEALEAYRSSLAATERVRVGATVGEASQAGVIASRRDAFIEAADLLVEMRRPAEALDVVEAYKARTLLDQLALAAQKYSGVATAPTKIEAEAMPRLVKPGAALVEYLLGEKQSQAWVVTPAGITVVALAGRATIQTAIDGFRRAVSAPATALTLSKSMAEANRYSLELTRLVFDPLRRALVGVTSVTVVPDGALAYVPFEALIDKPGATPTYLFERFDITYAPSAAVLAALDARGASHADRALLAVGDPRYGTGAGARAPLPATRDEVNGIAGLFPTDARRVLLGLDAREDVLTSERLARYRFVHLAAHGVLDERRPFRSGIALVPTPDNADNDGVLRVDEIAALRFDADMVTLSACETGLGRLVSGEGVLGLARAFLVAGARSVVMSLWNVNDEATAALMTSFYAQVAKGRSRAAAMRAARLELARGERRTWRHPYSWAAFTLVGSSN